MGVNVYDRKKNSDLSFDRNWWYWRPLWAYVQEVAGDLVANIDGDYNSGEGFENAEQSKELAKKLRASVDSGYALAWQNKRQAELDQIPNLPCEVCHATGIRTDAVGVHYGMPWQELNAENAEKFGRPRGYCNGCQGSGEKEPSEKWYVFDAEDVAEFAEFLENCEGFQIC
jgi:hypothetical protein